MEILAWILFIVGVVVGGIAMFAIASLAIFLFVMSSDAPGSGKSASAWTMRGVILVGGMAGIALIFYWISAAYLALQADNPYHTILLMLIGFAVGIAGYLAFVLKNR